MVAGVVFMVQLELYGCMFSVCVMLLVQPVMSVTVSVASKLPDVFQYTDAQGSLVSISPLQLRSKPEFSNVQL